MTRPITRSMSLKSISALQFASCGRTLPGIPPFESWLGIRYHRPCQNPAWGIQVSARVVEDQDLVAASLLETAGAGFPNYDLRTFWCSREGIMLAGGVESSTNKQYQEHLNSRTE